MTWDYDEELRHLPDPDRARKVEFSISCRGKQEAERARQAIEVEGFIVDVHPPQGGQRYWVLNFWQVAVLTPDYLRSMERKWTALAATLDEGVYGSHGYEWGDELPPSDTPELDRAAEALLTTVPTGWKLMPIEFDQRRGLWVGYAYDPDERGRKGRRHRECLVSAPTQLQTVQQLVDCLRGHH